MPVMTTSTPTLAPGALAERERVLRILRAQAMARGEAGPESDVDLLIEVDPAAGFGLSDLLDVQDELGRLLDRRINFAFASEMRPWLRAWIEEDRIGIFRWPAKRRGSTWSTSARPLI